MGLRNSAYWAIPEGFMMPGDRGPGLQPLDEEVLRTEKFEDVALVDGST